jgi:DNA-binding PadR family transcriptional regulator
MKASADAPLVSQKEAVILGILLSLAEREAYGLRILQDSAGLLKRGTIYVTLQRMEEKGLIDSRQEPRQMPEVGIPRRLYSVTGLGALAFAEYKRLHEKLSDLLALA